MKKEDQNTENEQLPQTQVMRRVDLFFEIRHVPTDTTIVMDNLSICEEYSSVSFSSNKEEYDGIGRLPSYVGDDTAKDYEIFVIINGEKFIYDGNFYAHDNSWLSNPKYKDGNFYGKRKHGA